MSKYKTQIIELAKQRIPPKDISAKLGVEVSSVYEVIRLARRNGDEIASFRVPPSATAKSSPAQRVVETAPVTGNLVLPNRLNSLLVREAERRGKTPVELAQSILETALLGEVRG